MPKAWRVRSMSEIDDSFDDDWRITPEAGPAERQVLEAFHRLSREERHAECAHWAEARMKAVVEDCKEEEGLENPS